MRRILIIDDEKPVRDLLKIALTNDGYIVFEAEDGKHGFKLFKETNPDIVIADVKMPGISGIEVTRKIKELTGNTDVLIMTGYGTEDLVIEALRAGASNYIKKPIVLNELYNLLDDIVIKRVNKTRSEVIKDVVVFEQKDIVLDNDFTKVWGTINQILYNLPSSVNEKIIEGMRVGLYEIIINAIEHGNLGISYSEKSKALKEGMYSKLIIGRSNKANEEGKRIFIHCSTNGSELMVEVKDQGKGFNYKELPNLNDPDTFLSSHGRGIFLASLYFDKVEFKDPGNTVLLTKKLI